MLQNSMPQGIIFDLDVVLINSEPVNIKAAQEAFAEFGYTLSGDDVALIPGWHSIDYAPAIIENNGLPFPPAQVATCCRERFNVLWKQMVVLMPGAQETLATLQQKGIILALVTSSDRSGIDRFLQTFKFVDIFSVTVSADDVTHRKPHPEPYLKAITKLALQPEALIVVEDTAVGAAAAKAAGLRCAAIPNEYTNTQDFSQTEYILKSLQEIAGLV